MTTIVTPHATLIHLDRAPAPLLRGHHVHSCPECYEHVPCEMVCHCEPDLALDDGTPRGAYVACDRCAPKAGGAT